MSTRCTRTECSKHEGCPWWWDRRWVFSIWFTHPFWVNSSTKVEVKNFQSTFVYPRDPTRRSQKEYNWWDPKSWNELDSEDFQTYTELRNEDSLTLDHPSSPTTMKQKDWRPLQWQIIWQRLHLLRNQSHSRLTLAFYLLPEMQGEFSLVPSARSRCLYHLL